MGKAHYHSYGALEDLQPPLRPIKSGESFPKVKLCREPQPHGTTEMLSTGGKKLHYSIEHRFEDNNRGNQLFFMEFKDINSKPICGSTRRICPGRKNEIYFLTLLLRLVAAVIFLSHSGHFLQSFIQHML